MILVRNLKCSVHRCLLRAEPLCEAEVLLQCGELIMQGWTDSAMHMVADMLVNITDVMKFCHISP